MPDTMKRGVGVALLLLLLFVGWREPVTGQQTGPTAPTISFIESPTATCYRPALETNECYISWAYLRVTATAPNYVISMTVAIDGRMAAYQSGFFQTLMVIPSGMYAPGFRVPCGAIDGASPEGLGGAHSYVVRARETGGLTAANYGTVICPAGTMHVYMPVLLRRTATS